jgi:hypothetical protein
MRIYESLCITTHKKKHVIHKLSSVGNNDTYDLIENCSKSVANTWTNVTVQRNKLHKYVSHKKIVLYAGKVIYCIHSLMQVLLTPQAAF